MTFASFVVPIHIHMKNRKINTTTQKHDEIIIGSCGLDGGGDTISVSKECMEKSTHKAIIMFSMTIMKMWNADCDEHR